MARGERPHARRGEHPARRGGMWDDKAVADRTPESPTELESESPGVKDPREGEPEPASAGAAQPRPISLRFGLIALGVVAFFALKEFVFWDPPLSFTVGAAAESGVLHDWESAPDDAPLALRF